MSDVLTIEADVSAFESQRVQTLTIYLGKSYTLNGKTLEFDIKTTNMTQWVSLMPFDGENFGAEQSMQFPNEKNWVHVSLSVGGDLTEFNSVVLYFQATTPTWFGGDTYDPQKNSVVQLANFKIKEGEVGEGPIRFGKDGDNNSLWAGTTADHRFEFIKEQIDGVESDVLKIDADVSGFGSGTVQTLTIYFDETYSLSGKTVEFDIKTENMTEWVSMMPFDGTNFGVEQSMQFSEQDDWVHITLSASGTMAEFNSIVLYFQATTPTWFGGDTYNSAEHTVIKLANFIVS